MVVPHGANERLQAQLFLPPLSAAANLACDGAVQEQNTERLGYNGRLLN